MKFIIILSLTLSLSANAQQVTVGAKNFRSIYYSLSAVTGVKPTKEINDYFKTVMTRLPKEGRLDEISSPSTLMSVKALASMFCKEFSQQNTNLTSMSNEQLLDELSSRIYGRVLSQNEAKNLLSIMGDSKSKNVFLVCTAMTSSMEFLLQ